MVVCILFTMFSCFLCTKSRVLFESSDDEDAESTTPQHIPSAFDAMSKTPFEDIPEEMQSVVGEDTAGRLFTAISRGDTRRARNIRTPVRFDPTGDKTWDEWRFERTATAPAAPIKAPRPAEHFPIELPMRRDILYDFDDFE